MPTLTETATFPVLSHSRNHTKNVAEHGRCPAHVSCEQCLFARHLAAVVRVSRPRLVEILTLGELNALDSHSFGALQHKAYRDLYSADSILYDDESHRSRTHGNRSQVETLRLWVRNRITKAWSNAFPDAEPFPFDAITFTPGDSLNNVRVWRNY